jgi:ribosomal protein L12E/L44/L45/RPP1/RPP2
VAPATTVVTVVLLKGPAAPVVAPAAAAPVPVAREVDEDEDEDKEEEEEEEGATKPTAWYKESRNPDWT